MYNFKYVFIVFTLFTLLIAGNAQATLYPPEKEGPYGVGYKEIELPFGTFITGGGFFTGEEAGNTIRVWYPTEKNVEGDFARYGVIVPSQLNFGSYEIFDYSSGLIPGISEAILSEKAKRDVPANEDGPFPLLIYVNGTTERGYLGESSHFEHLASHGFVVATQYGIHTVLDPTIADCSTAFTFQDIKTTASIVIGSGLADANKIGLISYSAGAPALIDAAVGSLVAETFDNCDEPFLDFAPIEYWQSLVDPAPLPGVKGLMLIEANNSYSPTNTDAVGNLPVMFYGGSELFGSNVSSESFLTQIQSEYAAFPSSRKLLVETRGISHVSHVSNWCQLSERYLESLSSASIFSLEQLFFLAQATFFSVYDMLPAAFGGPEVGTDGYPPGRYFCEAEKYPLTAGLCDEQVGGAFFSSFFGVPFTDGGYCEAVGPTLVKQGESNRLKNAYAVAFFKAFVDENPWYYLYLIPGLDRLFFNVKDTNNDGYKDAKLKISSGLFNP